MLHFMIFSLQWIRQVFDIRTHLINRLLATLDVLGESFTLNLNSAIKLVLDCVQIIFQLLYLCLVKGKGIVTDEINLILDIWGRGL